jgi:hypothetical protein
MSLGGHGSVCPFCKAPVPSSSRPCPRCGKLASDHPSVAQTQGRTLDNDWDDDDVPDLSLASNRPPAMGRGVASHAPSANPYDQGGLTLDDDFDDPVPPGALELDVPMGHGATAPRPPGGAANSMAPEHSVPPASSRAPGPVASRASGAPRLRGDETSRAPPSSSRAPAPPLSSNPGMRSGNPGAMSGHPGAMSHPPTSSPRSLPAALPSGDLPGSGGYPQQHSAPPAEPPPPPAKADPAAIVARYPPPPSAVWQAPGYALRVLWRQFELRQDLTSLRKRRSPDVPLYERALKTHDPKAFVLGLVLTGAMFVMVTFIVFLPVIIRYINKPPE